MGNTKIKRVCDVTAWRMCMGCGACAYACPNNAVSLVNHITKGIRPVIDDDKCEYCMRCVKICPGYELSNESSGSDGLVKELYHEWGPVRQIWEGHACDKEVRFRGSSGGAATAIGLYCLEKENAAGVLHVGAKQDDPITNHAVLSRTKEELISRCGSRYAPAAACENFGFIKDSEGKFVFIGKPCDVAALAKIRRVDPELDEKILLTISIFCAGTPSTLGTHNVLKTMGVEYVYDLNSFRYRGHGWPGQAVAELKNSSNEYNMSYSEMWGGILSKHGQLRCRLCADSTGEFADIACGDPWYLNIRDNEPGQSLVIARTQRGEHIIQKCRESQYINLHDSQPDHIINSQVSVHERRRELWGRLIAFKIFGIPCPKFENMNLFKSWWSLGLKAKTKSVLSTVKRILLRRLYRPE